MKFLCPFLKLEIFCFPLTVFKCKKKKKNSSTEESSKSSKGHNIRVSKQPQNYYYFFFGEPSLQHCLNSLKTSNNSTSFQTKPTSKLNPHTPESPLLKSEKGRKWSQHNICSIPACLNMPQAVKAKKKKRAALAVRTKRIFECHFM